MSMGTIQEKSSGEFKQLVIDDTERLEGQIAHAIPEMTASILIPIFVFAYLLFVDWRMALASLASAVLGNVIYYSMMICHCRQEMPDDSFRHNQGGDAKANPTQLSAL